MTDSNQKQTVKNKILKVFENTFSAILDEKFVPLNGKKVVDLNSIITFCDFAFDDFDEIDCEFKNNKYTQQYRIILEQVLKDFLAKSYYIPVRLHQKCKVVDESVVKTIMEETLRKVKN